MTLEEYFEKIKEYINSKTEDADNILTSLKKENIQAIINKNYNNNTPPEETAESILNVENYNNINNDEEIDTLGGERMENTMESNKKNIMSFKEFNVKNK